MTARLERKQLPNDHSLFCVMMMLIYTGLSILMASGPVGLEMRAQSVFRMRMVLNFIVHGRNSMGDGFGVYRIKVQGTGTG